MLRPVSVSIWCKTSVHRELGRCMSVHQLACICEDNLPATPRERGVTRKSPVEQATSA